MRRAIRYIFFCHHHYRRRQKKDAAAIPNAKQLSNQKRRFTQYKFSYLYYCSILKIRFIPAGSSIK